MKHRLTRRGFARQLAVATGLLFIPSGILKPRTWLFDVDSDKFLPVIRQSGLQAASVIKDRTISSVSDKRIQLSNSNFARLWSSTLGTSWTKIRLAVRFGITDSGSNITGSPRFAFGIQVGTTNLFMDAGGPSHWCGFLSVDSSWSRSTSGGVGYYSIDSATGGAPQKKINTTITSGGVFGTVAPIITDATAAWRSAFLLDITKGSPNFTFANLRVRSNTTIADITQTDFLTEIENAAPSFANHSSNGSSTVAIDESTNGFFNAVGIAWNKTAALIELSDLAIVKIS